MSNRKYPSGYEKLKKKRKIKNSSKEKVEQTNLNELGDNEVMVEKTIKNDNDERPCDNVIVDKEGEENNEKDEIDMEIRDLNENFSVSIDMYNPGRWKNIDNKHFSTSYYMRKLLNGEKHDRRWLIYSKDFDKIYCFCCKLFSTKFNVTQLGNEGNKDWKNLGKKLKSHETSNEHIMNMSTWFDVELRFPNDKTIDREVNVLVKIIAIMKSLANNNLVFCGDNEKIYQKNDENFLLQMLALEVKNSILKKIKEAKYFSIVLDCTPNVSHQEQMSLIIRCVDISTSLVRIEEYFLGFLNVDDTSRACLFRKHQGVQKRLLEINPRALYTPCGCHSLNLVIFLQCIYSLFASSPKRWKILKNNISSLTVKPLSQTHWESCIESVKAIRFQAPNIRDALLELVENSDDSKIKSEAKCLATYELENFEFLLGMTIWYDILFAINSVSKIFQYKDMHIDVAIDQLKGPFFFFENYRKNGFAYAMISVKEIANEMEVEPKFREKSVIRKKKRKKQFDENVGDDTIQS
ncbi:hypothetical protein UlMin_042956, partial [Ulmus minor]